MAILNILGSLDIEAFVLLGFPLLVMAGTLTGMVAMLIAALTENNMGG